MRLATLHLFLFTLWRPLDCEGFTFQRFTSQDTTYQSLHIIEQGVFPFVATQMNRRGGEHILSRCDRRCRSFGARHQSGATFGGETCIDECAAEHSFVDDMADMHQ
jgi:hypothetical protein